MSVSTADTFDSRLQLLADTFQTNPTRGAERSVVAKIASSLGDGPIDVGARKSGIDADSLDTASESAAQRRPKRVEW